jgi:hypothetical protein
MPILGIHHVPSLTQEKYEEVVRRLTNGKSRLESPSDVGADGLLVHVAAQGEDGLGSSTYSSHRRHPTGSARVR